MSFAGVDFLGLEEMYTDEERAVRDVVRRWVDERVLPIIEECAYEGTHDIHTLVLGQAVTGFPSYNPPME